MGITRASVKLLLDRAKVQPFSGAILTLGRQAIFVREDELRRWADERGVALSEDAPANALPLAGRDYLDDRRFFGLLGFSEQHSCDVSADEHPTFTLDLNSPTPPVLAERYDAIYNGGTIEHVFDVAASLRNVFTMLKPGGLAIHTGPSSNHVDHGFYMFSPTLFHDYYAENGHEILASYLLEYELVLGDKPWDIYPYSPGDLDHLSLGGFDRGSMLGFFFIARKTQTSTCNRTPQQSYYARQRGRGADVDITAEDIQPPPRPHRSTGERIAREIARWQRKLSPRQRKLSPQSQRIPIARY